MVRGTGERRVQFPNQMQQICAVYGIPCCLLAPPMEWKPNREVRLC